MSIEEEKAKVNIDAASPHENGVMEQQSEEEKDEWQNKLSSHMEHSEFIFKNKLWTDCQVIVGTEDDQKTFACHRLYLAQFSPILAKQIFESKIAIKQIYLPHITPKCFEQILNFIYTEAIGVLNWEDMVSLARTANILDIQRLLKACLSYLHQYVDAGNACILYELSRQVGKSKEAIELGELAFEVMCRNTTRILEEASFECIQLDTLIKLLQQNDLQVPSDVPIIEACIRWAKSERRLKKSNTNIRDVLGPAFSLLRFMSLTPGQFASLSHRNDLLSHEESLAILLNINTPGSIGLPTDVCTIMETRHGYVFGFGKQFLLQPSMKEEHHSNGKPEWCEYSFEFSCDSDLILLGVQICSQKKPEIINSPKKMKLEFYKERLEVTFEKPKPRSRVAMQFNSTVQFDSRIPIKFDKPFLIQRGTKYKLYVHLREAGVYPVGLTSGVINIFGGELQFQANKANFFHSLVFMR